jgi:hypothetical protein
MIADMDVRQHKDGDIEFLHMRFVLFKVSEHVAYEIIKLLKSEGEWLEYYEDSPDPLDYFLSSGNN